MDVSSVVTRVLVFVVAVVLMLSTIVSAQDEIVDMDHIKDPEFTLWQLPPEANVSREDEEAVLTVASEKPVGSFAVFAFKVQPNVRKVKIEAQVKVTDGRQGVNSWDKPRIHLTFHDGRGNQIGGWPDAGMWTGAKDWFSITKTFDLPAGATSVRVYGAFTTAQVPSASRM